MAVNLIDLLENQFSGNVVSNLASAIGEDPASTQRALGGALPAVLGRLVSTASTEHGAADLLRLVQGAGLDGTRLGTPAAALASGSATSDLLRTGGPLIASLFGSQQDGLFGWLASFAGISRSSATTLLGLVAPFVLNLVSRQAAASGTGFNASSLAGLLGKQAGFLQNLPAGLAGAAGVSQLATSAGSAISGVTAASEGVGLGWLKWALPLVLALGLVWLLRSNRGVDQTATAAAEGTAPAAATAPATPASADSASAPAAATTTAPSVTSAYGIDLGALVSRRLPNGVELQIPTKGVEAQLASFIEDTAKPVSPDLWFTLDRTEFETGSATLKPSAQDQLRNVAAILNAFPSVAIKVGGYTDNTGNAAANLKLSEERAVNTMKALAALGVPDARLAAEGYGQEHPVASNDTAEGRQRNRRIDLRVTRK